MSWRSIPANLSMSMSVLGLGIDLVEVPRIRALLEKGGDRFKQRVYTAGEIAYCDSCPDGAMNYAARFAAKEAVAKALGTGFSNGVSWKDIEVLRSEGGMPSVRLHGGAQTVAESLQVAKVLVTSIETSSASTRNTTACTKWNSAAPRLYVRRLDRTPPTRS